MDTTQAMGRLDLDTLRSEVEVGKIDTVLLAMTDMQGRLQGKRLTASHFLDEVVEMVMPGDNTSITAELHTPVALEKGARFAIREGGRTVGAGTISEILE